jgi:hypothetical protein
MNLIILDTANKTLVAKMGESATTTEPAFTSHWADSTSSNLTEGSTDGTLNGTTYVALVTAPGASTRRVIKEASIYNSDTVAHSIILAFDNNGTQRIIWSGTLPSLTTFYLSRVLSSGGGSFLTTKGDIATFSTVNTALPVGTDDFALIADDTEATGLKWVNIATRSESLSSKTLVTPKVITAYSNGNLGATPTINWANGDLQTGTLSASTTLDFSGAVAGQRLSLFLLENGTGTYTIAFTPTIVWQDATVPTWTTTANKWNGMVIFYTGSEYVGMGAKFA